MTDSSLYFCVTQAISTVSNTFTCLQPNDRDHIEQYFNLNFVAYIQVKVSISQLSLGSKQTGILYHNNKEL